jgi:chromosome partitioning protein
MIYAIVNTKGGVGKTTTAVHLAAMLSGQHNTLLIDGDPQTSAASWAAWRRESKVIYHSPTTTALSGKAILQEGKELAVRYSHTVVDAGGRDSTGLRAALLLSNRAIVPIGASNLDAAAMTDLLEIVDLAREYNPELDVRVLLTRIDVRTKDDNDEMVKYLKMQGLNILSTRIYERVAYRRAIGEGLIVHELKTKDSLAIAEMEMFYKEVTQ